MGFVAPCDMDTFLCIEDKVAHPDHLTGPFSHRQLQQLTNLPDVDTAPILEKRRCLHGDSVRLRISGAFQVGDDAVAGLHQLVRLDAEHVTADAATHTRPRSGSCRGRSGSVNTHTCVL